MQPDRLPLDAFLRAVRSRESAAAGSTAVDLTGLRILVVDDDAQVRRLVAAILTRAGADVKTAPCADAAWKTCAAFQPNILVSDIEMPGEDGLSLMRRIRECNASGRGPVAIAMSGMADSDAGAQSALSAGFTRYVCKPFLPPELLAAVAAVASCFEWWTR